MKKISLLLSLILALSVLASCSRTEADVSVDTEDIELTQMLKELGADEIIPAIECGKTVEYDNKKYMCKTGGEIGVIDLSDDSYTKLSVIEGASELFVLDDVIYVVCDRPAKITTLDLSGNIIKELKLPDIERS